MIILLFLLNLLKVSCKYDISVIFCKLSCQFHPDVIMIVIEEDLRFFFKKKYELHFA